MEAIELLETIRRTEDPFDGLLDPTRPAQSRAEAAIAQAKIQAMGLAPSDREIDEAEGLVRVRGAVDSLHQGVRD